jgi:hypothetical protein
MHSMHSPETHTVTQTVLDPGIGVRTDDKTTWMEALARAEDERITLVRIRGAADNFPSEAHIFKVKSAENTYFVNVFRFVSPLDGVAVTEVGCTCRHGEQMRICTHAALAVNTANCWPDGFKDDDESITPARQKAANMLLAERWRK